VLFTWPIAPRAGDAMSDLWDAKLNAWIFHWDFHQTLRDPFHLFDANIFHPARYTLALSENLFGAALFGFPLYAAGTSTLFAYNFLFLLGVFLSALGAWALAREVTGDAEASLLAGIVYALSPWRMSQIPHVRFQWGVFLPLLLLFLVRFLEGGRRLDLALFAVCFAWNALTNVHYALFSGVLVGVLLVFEALRRGSSARKRLLAALAAAGVAALAVSPFFLPYARVSRMYGLRRSAHEAEFYSGRVTEFLAAGVRNKLYGAATQRFSHAEGDFFPGLVPLALATVAVARSRRRRPAEIGTDREGESPSEEPRQRRAVLAALDGLAVALAALFLLAEAKPGLRVAGVAMSDAGRIFTILTAVVVVRWAIAFPRRFRYRNLGDSFARGPWAPGMARLLLVGLTGVFLALGLHTPYYRFAFQTFGVIFGAIRAPSRGIVLFQLALGVLAAWGLSGLAARGGGWRRVALVAGALALTGLEYRAFPIDVKPVEAKAPPVYSWLAGVDLGSGAVVEWPLGDWFDSEYEFRSTAHWKPLVNGYSGFGPPTYRRIRELLGRVPIAESAWGEMARLGGALVVFHPHDAAPAVLAACASELRLRTRRGDAEVLRAFAHGADTDYVFRVRGAPVAESAASDAERLDARRRFEELTLRPGLDPSPPLAALDFPPDDAELSPGEWAWGWALDDSGIAQVRVSTELGPAGAASYGGARPDVTRAFSAMPGSDSPAFQFRIPALSSGPHVLTVTVAAKDGGETVLNRAIRIR